MTKKLYKGERGSVLLGENSLSKNSASATRNLLNRKGGESKYKEREEDYVILSGVRRPSTADDKK